MSRARIIADSWNNVGGSSTDVLSRRLEVDTTNDSYIDERIYRASIQYTTWTTIATVTPSSIPASLFGSGMVEATITGLTNGIGVGVHHSQWVWNFNAGVLTFTTMYTDESTATAPEFQLVSAGGSPEAIACQVQGSAGSGSITGGIFLRFHMPGDQQGVTYTIS